MKPFLIFLIFKKHIKGFLMLSDFLDFEKYFLKFVKYLISSILFDGSGSEAVNGCLVFHFYKDFYRRPQHHPWPWYSMIYLLSFFFNR